MSEYLAWALDRAREQTLGLVADVPADALRLPAAPDEKHPGWILGHLLLADTYLLTLLAGQPLADDFPLLLERYGPASTSGPGVSDDAWSALVHRLRRVNASRVASVSALGDGDLARPLTDAILARSQPTIGHHLQSLVFHEGYHGGQLSSWRKRHGLPPVRWALGPCAA